MIALDRYIYNACTFMTEQELCDSLHLTNEELCDIFRERIDDMIRDNEISLEEGMNG